MKIYNMLASCVFLIGLMACGKHAANELDVELSLSSGSSFNSNPPATVYFYNESSFVVNVYKNLNPEHFDPTALICVVSPGETKKVELYASFDDKVGDTFYMRYKVLLADAFKTGTDDIRVEAERTLSNLNFVVESGKSYTKTIPQPNNASELRFVNGYIEVQNTGSTLVRIERGTTVLEKMDDKRIQILPGQHLGYYEMPIHYLDASLTVDKLRAFSSYYIDFPSFVMERGKLYSFNVDNTTVTGPNISSINPMEMR